MPGKPLIPLFVSIALLVGCTEAQPLYCDEDTPCTDPVLAFCDLEGIFAASGMHGHTCIAIPFDASSPDAFIDAGGVPCTEDAHCTLPLLPICDLVTKSCRACMGGAECASRSPSTPACVSDGHCAACLTSSDCTGAVTPICLDHECGACTTPEQCTNKDPSLSYCDTAMGQCLPCAPASFLRCDADTRVTCDAQGASEITLTCAYGCNASAMRCNDCVPSTSTCAASTLQVCDESGIVSQSQTCDLGCHPSGTRCNAFSPSNQVLGELLDLAATAAPLVLSGTTSVDTDTGAIVSGGTEVPATHFTEDRIGVKARVYVVGSLNLSGTVTVRGERALVILSDGIVTITGTLSVAAQGSKPGPGSYEFQDDDGACHGQAGTFSTDDTIAGTGGGSFQSKGGAGGDAGSRAGTLPGTATTTLDLIPLRGGCRGGLLRNSSGLTYGFPGGGGGALQISSRTDITVLETAILNAGGGGAEKLLGFGNAGGGSGGGILLEAPIVYIDGGESHPRIAANGGSGGCMSVSGLDATTTSLGATAPACDDSTTQGKGGNGGSNAKDYGGQGESKAGAPPVYGGGGGGGIGVIRINTKVDGLAIGNAILSPSPSVGSIATR